MTKTQFNKWAIDLPKAQKTMYEKMVYKVFPKLKKMGYLPMAIPWRKNSDNGFYFVDYLWDLVQEQDRDYLEKPYIMFGLKLDNGKFVELDNVCMQHNISGNPDIMKLMKQEFGRKFKWNGSANKAICIKV